MGEMRDTPHRWEWPGKEGTLLLQEEREEGLLPATELTTEARDSGPAGTGLGQGSSPTPRAEGRSRAQRPAGRAGRSEHGSLKYETRSVAESGDRQRSQGAEGRGGRSQRAGRRLENRAAAGKREARSRSGPGLRRRPLPFSTRARPRRCRAEEEEGRGRPELRFPHPIRRRECQRAGACGTHGCVALTAPPRTAWRRPRDAVFAKEPNDPLRLQTRGLPKPHAVRGVGTRETR